MKAFVCLWDSQYTEYDVANSGNKMNVIEAVAKECKAQGIYCSLWDRKENADVKDESLDMAYNTYMINQLNELMDITAPYTDIVEFWFDGSWAKPNYQWPLKEIYTTINAFGHLLRRNNVVCCHVLRENIYHVEEIKVKKI